MDADTESDHYLNNVFFYLGFAILLIWVCTDIMQAVIIVLLVRHYWWAWIRDLCVRDVGARLCCRRRRRHKAGEDPSAPDEADAALRLS